MADSDPPRGGDPAGCLTDGAVAAVSRGPGHRSAGGAGVKLTGSDKQGSRWRVARAAAGWAPARLWQDGEQVTGPGRRSWGRAGGGRWLGPGSRALRGGSLVRPEGVSQGPRVADFSKSLLWR